MNDSPALSMKGLPYVPMDPQWLMDSPAFLSDDPKLVRAIFSILTRAWESIPAGSVSSNFKSLAMTTGLSEAEVVDHYDDLFSGWVLNDGRMYFPPMNALCERITARFADNLQDIADQSAAVVQAPEDFVLTPTESEPGSVTKGRRRLPNTWRLSDELKMWAGQNGFATAEDVSFIEMKFFNNYSSKGEKMVNWDAAFRNFALKENLNYLPSRRAVQATPAYGSRASRFGSAGASARAHNTSSLEAAAMRSMGAQRG